MAIQDIQEAAEMRDCFKDIGGRAGLSDRAIEICKLVAKSESRREAIYAIGRMARLYQVSKADGYWGSKAFDGRNLEHYAVKQAAANDGDFSKAIDAFGDDKR